MTLASAGNSAENTEALKRMKYCRSRTDKTVSVLIDDVIHVDEAVIVGTKWMIGRKQLEAQKLECT